MEKRQMKTVTTKYCGIELQFAAVDDNNDYNLQELDKQQCFAPSVNTEWLSEGAELEAGGLLNCWGTAEFAWCWEYAMRNKRYFDLSRVILELIKLQYFTKYPNAKHCPRINRVAEIVDFHRSQYQPFKSTRQNLYLPTRTEMLEKARWETDQYLLKQMLFGEAA